MTDDTVIFTEKGFVTHRDGVAWNDAEIPGRWHRCTPQSHGVLRGNRIDRCACGAIRRDFGKWVHRNSRRGLR